MNNASQLRRNVILNTAGNLVFFASQYLLIILVMRLSGAYANGLLSTAMNLANPILSFACYGMRSFQVSDFTPQYSDRTYLHSRYVTVLAAGLGCCGFAMAVSYTAEQRIVILLYTLCRLSEGLVDVWHGYLQKAERMDLVGISFGVRGLASIVSFAAGLALTQNLIFTLAVMCLLNWLYVFAVDIPFGRKNADFAFVGGGTVAALLLECLPLAVYSFLNSSVGSVVKHFCERLCGTEAFGNFNSIFAPVQILQVGAAYIFVPFITLFAHWWADREGKKFLRGLLITFAALGGVWLCGSVGAALLGPWAFSLLYGQKILPYMTLLQPLVAATIITTLVLILCHLLTVAREMKGLIVGNLAGIAASFVLAGPMIGAFGTTGAAWATVLSRLVQAALMLAFLLRRCRRQFAPSRAD